MSSKNNKASFSMKELYSKVAKENNTTPDTVEKDLLRIIDEIWENENQEHSKSL